MPVKARLDVLRDSVDFRDFIYSAKLKYPKSNLIPKPEFIRVLDQGNEGACTGFGLAASINYLNLKRKKDEAVSPRMLYEMAKRHDQWPGEKYQGSSCRGAMKGWYKNGVCPEQDWPYSVNQTGFLTQERQNAALKFPLGAYYRVLKNRSFIQSALNETGVVFASANIHSGWEACTQQKTIPFEGNESSIGGHAFALVGYTKKGFLVLNSWGEQWGGFHHRDQAFPGVALWDYNDFDVNLWDAWVFELALPFDDIRGFEQRDQLSASARGPRERTAPTRQLIADHYVHIDDGQLDPQGDYPSFEPDVDRIINAMCDPADTPKHLLLYAHGGLNSVKAGAIRAMKMTPVMKKNGIYPLHFIWETGLVAEIKDILLGKDQFAKERAGGFSDWTDKVFEKSTRKVGGAIWSEMKRDARRAFEPDAAGYNFIERLIIKLKALPESKRPKVQIVGHSAGSILHGYLLSQWHHFDGPPIDNVVLMAPACSHEFFNNYYTPILSSTRVKEFHHFLLSDELEKDDHVAYLYRKSLLYLVSHSYDLSSNVSPILGMERYLDKILWKELGIPVKHYLAGSDHQHTQSKSHGGFDNDRFTMNQILALLVDGEIVPYTKKDLDY